MPIVLYVLTALTVVSVESSVLSDHLSRMNEQFVKLSSVRSQLSWEEALQPKAELSHQEARFAEVEANWRNFWCWKLRDLHYLQREDFRQFYLMCRGLKYDGQQAREIASLVRKVRGMQLHKRICHGNGSHCYGVSDMRKLIATSHDPENLLWAWVEWRNSNSEEAKVRFGELVNLIRIGVRNNGYRDTYEWWRDELEMKDPEGLGEKLFAEVMPLYKALHAVVRHRLNRLYGSDLVPLDEGIPVHLLGSIRGEDWTNLLPLMMPSVKEWNLTSRIKLKNYTFLDIAKRAEDYFVSLGFRPMTENFWNYSKLATNESDCPPRAINMFRPGDYRVLLCSELTSEGVRSVYREIGTIEYFMECNKQPGIFQDGVSSAFRTAVGNAVAYGALSPYHLQRLGLISEDEEWLGPELMLLLDEALSKLPVIPFALAGEKWRRGIEEGSIPPGRYNEIWWILREDYQGVKPPVPRREEFFDPGADLNLDDNTPVINTLLSSILEVQIFEALCKGSFFGHMDSRKSIPIPLHRCDIYGSKEGTEKLREVMSLGKSLHWSDALRVILGTNKYSARPLLNYYRPLYTWLVHQINKYDIPVGW